MERRILLSVALFLLAAEVKEINSQCSPTFDDRGYRVDPEGVEISEGDEVTFTCKNRFRISGQRNNFLKTKTITCTNRNGRFRYDSLRPCCEPVRCPPPPSPPGFNIIPVPAETDVPDGGTYTYSCLPGYSTEESMTTQCTVSGGVGTWSMILPPLCEKVSCGAPENGTNTVLVNGSTNLLFNEGYCYECLPGYETTDPLVTVCQADGNFSLSSPPNCTLTVTCPPPPEGVYTVPVLNGTTYHIGDAYMYYCLQGYTTNDTQYIQCTTNGTWSADAPNCTKVMCGKPGEGRRTLPVPSDLNLKFLEAYTYECQTGFIPRGEVTVVCQVDGTFEPSTQVRCRRDRTDYCASSPCNGGGTCTNGVGGFCCECPVGRSGPTCNRRDNMCLSQPCANGGTCNGDRDSFTCTCPDTWTGPTCEERNCPPGWIKSDMHVCYLIGSVLRSWFSSASNCINSGGRLAILKTVQQVQDLANINSGLINVNYWIGGGQVFNEFAPYVWLDETPVDSSLISAGASQLQSDANDMITFQFKNGFPNFVLGSKTSNNNLRYICEQ